MKNKKFGEKISDQLANFAGSWTFILMFIFSLCSWIWYNCEFTSPEIFDPYPFILLNLFLSCLAAIQAPVILMSQNRQAEKDRKEAMRHFFLTYDLLQKVDKLEKRLEDK